MKIKAFYNVSVFKSEKKSVQFDEEVKVKTLAAEVEPEIDEGKIDQTIHLLHEADPTGERPDSQELLTLEGFVCFCYTAV